MAGAEPVSRRDGALMGTDDGVEPVDLRSDTVTRPSEPMRRAMAGAPVGDDVLDGDPTVGRLEDRVAEVLGKEEALFFPSGTQANQTALAVHTEPGQEVVIEERAHVFHYELAAPSEFWGVQLRPVASDRGRVGRDDYEPALRPGDRYHPRTGLLWTEDTHNAHGGTVAPVEGLREVRALARETGLPVHLDGARLWNASVAAGTPPDAFAATADTVAVSLSKGLGCPVGSVLAGPGDALEPAWTVRKRLGGGMRQAGILAAAGLHALDRGWEDLSEDHRRARRLAEGARSIDGLSAPEPETNIVQIGVEAAEVDAADVATEAGESGLLVLATGPGRLRAVTHREVGDGDVDRAVDALRRAVDRASSAGE